MTNPRISIALITFNRPGYLKLAIDAILAQSLSDFELFILDNGSSYETGELVRTYSDKRIKYIRNEINSKDFINRVWDLGSGDFLIVTHDDDIMKHNMLEKELDILLKNPEIIGVSSNITSIDSKGNILAENFFLLIHL